MKRHSILKYNHGVPFSQVQLRELHVFCSGAFGALHDIEAYRLAFRQGLESTGLNGTVVYKNIRTAVIPRDKPEAFAFVKPLHFTF